MTDNIQLTTAANTTFFARTTDLGSNIHLNLFEIANHAGSSLIGQKISSNSLPVTIASDQSNLNVSLVNSLPAGNNLLGNVFISRTQLSSESYSSKTYDYTISAGAVSYFVKNISASSCIVAGLPLAVNEVIIRDAPSGYTYPAIAITIANGSVIVGETR